MTKFKVLLADDEPPARKLLTDYVSKINALELVSVCSNGEEVLAYLKETDVDILLLDIRMPLMTGIDLLRSLERPPLTILITAYEEYAVKGFELDVIDYLVKPVAFERFKKAIDKAVEYLNIQTTPSGKEEKRDYFFIKTDTRIVRFIFSEVLVIEAQREYVKIVTHSRKVLSLVSLTSIAEVLPDDFIRIHRSYIINMRHIDEVESAAVIINKETYPISRNYRDAFFERLGNLKLL